MRLALRSVQEQGKPILALSIAPVLLVLAFEERLRDHRLNPSIDALQKMVLTQSLPVLGITLLTHAIAS